MATNPEDQPMIWDCSGGSGAEWLKQVDVGQSASPIFRDLSRVQARGLMLSSTPLPSCAGRVESGPERGGSGGDGKDEGAGYLLTSRPGGGERRVPLQAIRLAEDCWRCAKSAKLAYVMQQLRQRREMASPLSLMRNNDLATASAVEGCWLQDRVGVEMPSTRSWMTKTGSQRQLRGLRWDPGERKGLHVFIHGLAPIIDNARTRTRIHHLIIADLAGDSI